MTLSRDEGSDPDDPAVVAALDRVRAVREAQAAEEEISDLLAALEASVARHPAGRKRAKKGVA
jgi:non-homologous end joining protein Ku